MKNSFTSRFISALLLLCVMTLGQLQAQVWQQVDISELGADDVFMIVDVASSHAMTHSNGTASAPTAVSVTLNGDNTQVIGQVADDLKWNISGDANGYTFYPNGDQTKWLYCTNTNNGVRVGTNANKEFTMDNNWLKNTATNRWVGVYLNNPDWRCYTNTTGNISGTVTRFFKYVTSATSIATPEFSVAGGIHMTPQTVAITCETAGVDIRYTLDGSQPDGTSALYTEPLTISASTTLKAIACNATDTSLTATVTYRLPVAVTDLAALRAQATDGYTIYRLDGEAIVTLANSNRHNKYIQDATGAVLIDDYSGVITSEYAVGDAMSRPAGTLSLYNGMLQFTPIADPGAPVSSGNTVTPTILSSEELLAAAEDFEAQLITLTNVVIDPVTPGVETFEYNKYYNLNGETNPKLGIKYNDLDMIGQPIPTVAQNITGVVYDYNGTYEIFPRSMADFVDYEEIPINPETEYIDTAACVSFVWHDSTFTESGNYYWHNDSSVLLHLTIYQPDIMEITATSHGEYTWNEVTYTTSGDYDQSFVNVHGCDSMVTLHLTVLEPQTMDFVVNGNTSLVASMTGYADEPVVLPVLNGCESMNFAGWAMEEMPTPSASVPALYTEYAPATSTTFYAIFQNAVERDTIVITRGSFETVAGYGTPDEWSVTSAKGVQVNGIADLYTNPDNMQMRGSTPPHPYNTTALPGNIVSISMMGAGTGTARSWTPYLGDSELNADTYTTGTALGVQTASDNAATISWSVSQPSHFFYLKLASGATYIDNITVVFNTGDALYCSDPTRHVTLEASICDGDSYIDEHFNESTAGTYSTTVSEGDYCATEYTLNLTVLQPVSTEETVDACGEYIWHDIPYTESGDYTWTGVTELGCDSIVTLHLFIHTAVAASENAEACNEYLWHGTTYTESGDYTWIGVTEFGCDSVVTLHLTVNHGEYSYEEASTCELPYRWVRFGESEELFAPGTYTRGHVNPITQCEDVAEITLILHTPDTTRITAQICEGETYTQNGFNTSEPGEHRLYLHNQWECDSVIILTLSVGEEAITHLTDEACANGSYTENGFELYDLVEGVMHETLVFERPGTCDSIVELTLTVHAPDATTETATACDSYTWHGTSYTESGEYTWIGQNQYGCDSVVTLTLTINRSTSGSETATACEEYIWHGTTYTESGEYTWTTTNAQGCDSVVTLTLTIHQPTTGSETATACEEYIWHGTTYTESGEYTWTTTNANGCDSVVTLNLTIHQPTTGSETATACGEYIWHETTYTESGEYTWTTTNANGCDSVVTLTLTINQPVSAEAEVTICASDLPYTWNGIVFTEAGSETAALTADNGCDSTLVMTVTVTEINTEIEVVTFDFSESSEVRVTPQEGAEYQWINCDDNTPVEGATGDVFTPTESGDYACIITLNGCVDTTECEYVSASGIDESGDIAAKCYPNPTRDNVTVEADRMQRVTVYDLNGQQVCETPVDGDRCTMSTRSWAQGAYLFRILTADGIAYRKVMVVK